MSLHYLELFIFCIDDFSETMTPYPNPALITFSVSWFIFNFIVLHSIIKVRKKDFLAPFPNNDKILGSDEFNWLKAPQLFFSFY